jgi:hypothetical protein
MIERVEIVAGHTYEFRKRDDWLWIALDLLPDGKYMLSPKLIVRDKDHDEIRVFTNMLPLKGNLEHTSFMLQAAMDIAFMRGWTVTDRQKHN